MARIKIELATRDASELIKKIIQRASGGDNDVLIGLLKDADIPILSLNQAVGLEVIIIPPTTR